MKAREREGGSGIADGLPAKWAKQQVIRLFVRVIGVEEDEGGGGRSMVWGKMNEQRWRHRNCEANEAVTKWRKLRSEMTPASPRASQHAYHVEESNGFGRASFLSISAHTHTQPTQAIPAPVSMAQFALSLVSLRNTIGKKVSYFFYCWRTFFALSCYLSLEHAICCYRNAWCSFAMKLPCW